MPAITRRANHRRVGGSAMTNGPTLCCLRPRANGGGRLADPGVAPALRGSHPGGLCDLIRWPDVSRRRTVGGGRIRTCVSGGTPASLASGRPNHVHRRTPGAARQDAKRPASPPAQLQDSFGCGAFARSVSPRVRFASVLPLNECPIVPARGGQGSPPAAAAHGQRPAADGPAYHEKRPPISKPAGARAGKESTASVAGQRAGVNLPALPRPPRSCGTCPAGRQLLIAPGSMQGSGANP